MDPPTLRVVCFVAAATLLHGCAATAAAQEVRSSCTSTIQVLFDKNGMTRIPAGSTIWFTSVLKAVHTADGSAITSPTRIYVHQSRITFGGRPNVIAMPDSTVVLDPSISVSRRLWNGPEKLNVAYSPSQVSHEALFDALPYEAPEPFIPGPSGPVTWTATFAASRPGITIDWAWGAAVYSQFGPVGTFQLKPLSGPIAQVDPQAGPPDLYENNDSAGTPEAYKQFVIAGAMGTGAPQYTGARSEPASVVACRSSEPLPPAGPFQQMSPAVQHYFSSVRLVAASLAAPTFAWPVSQQISAADGSIWQAVVRCYATDLCALASYPNGDQMAIYSEGAAYCKPYALHFNRTNGGRTIYSFARDVDYDEYPIAHRPNCARTRPTHIGMDGGRLILGISQNADGSLRFHFAKP
ncbi:MAG: hypothetical protein WA304_12875 [Candidatus Cybelea sp.]